MRPWIGVDLDGTLAQYDGTTNGIGKPVPSMLSKVQEILKQDVYDVKIFTARASVPAMVPEVEKWLLDIGLPKLEVTNQKDFAMVALYDDRAITIIENTGKTVFEHYGIKP